MASNLITARSLIQADLDHARSVLSLWTHQVEELEKALAQIDAVGNSRNALRVQYQGASRAPALEAPAADAAKPRRGRKPKNADGAGIKPAPDDSRITAKRGRKLAQRSTAAPAQVSEAKGRKNGKAAGTQNGAAKHAPKYRDPDSGKTWSGLGRRPGWFVGQPGQYAIASAGKNGSDESAASAGPGQAGGAASPT